MGVDHTITLYRGIRLPYKAVLQNSALHGTIHKDFLLQPNGKVKEYMDDCDLGKLVDGCPAIAVERFSAQSAYEHSTFDPDDETVIVYINTEMPNSGGGLNAIVVDDLQTLVASVDASEAQLRAAAEQLVGPEVAADVKIEVIATLRTW